jgi:hypothetical protein
MDSGKQKKFSCPAFNCKASFTRTFNLNRHYERYHMNNDIAEKCLLCGLIFQNCSELQNHYKQTHKPTKNFVVKESAFKKSVVSYRYTFSNDNLLDLNQAQQKVLPAISSLVIGEASKKTLIKVGLIIICEMSMVDHVGEKMTTTMIPFRAVSFLVNGYNTYGLKRNILKSFSMQEHEMEEFCSCGSNWVFERVVALDVEIAPMKPILVGNETDSSSVSSEILSSEDEKCEFYDAREAKRFNVKSIRNNKFLYNPLNYDEKCFLYCVLKHLKQTRKRYRGWSFNKFQKTLDLSGLTFPISIAHIEKFCRQNSHLRLRINIILLNTKNHVFPLEYGIGKKDAAHTMNLLLVQRQTDENTLNNHFLLIKNIHRFLRKTYHDGSYKHNYTCVNCLNGFSSKSILEKHESNCCLHKPRMEILSKERVMKFKNYQNQHPLEYIGFLDFECVLPRTGEKCPECTHLRCKCDRSYTEPVANQYPITYSLVILDQDGNIIHSKTHSEVNVADHLIEHLLEEEEKWIENLFAGTFEMALVKKDWIKYHQTSNCYLCDVEFNDNVVKCRDHCHFTGQFLGASCQQCNLKRRRPRKLNIFLHNGSKYDFHFIIKAINDKKGVRNINILPYNGENFRTVSFNSFMFVDSMSFLQNSLAKLSEDLKNTDNEYTILRQTNLVKSNDRFNQLKFEMVLGKSFFPYEYW